LLIRKVFEQPQLALAYDTRSSYFTAVLALSIGSFSPASSLGAHIVLELGVFFFGLGDDGQVGVGILPLGEEGVVGFLRIGLVASQEVGAAQT
jgi:hypothetical protein